VTGDVVAAATLERKAIAAIVNVAGVIAPCSYHFVIVEWRTNGAESRCVKYWEIIADKLSKAGWSWAASRAIDSNGRTIRIADAHRSDGKRFVVRAEEKLTAFLELESATRLAIC
jgi:hypothetical protein